MKPKLPPLLFALRAFRLIARPEVSSERTERRLAVGFRDPPAPSRLQVGAPFWLRLCRARAALLAAICGLSAPPLRAVEPVQAVSATAWPNLAGGGGSFAPAFSADGRCLLFLSHANNLVTNDDLSPYLDVFVRDLPSGTTRLVSVNRNGTGPGNDQSSKPILAADGRTVVFQSFAGDLVAGDYNYARDVFVLHLGGRDTDADGLDDDWEMTYFSTLARNGAGDYDSDGQSDREEFIAGTDPTNSGSVLRVLTLTSPGTGATTVLWSAVPGRTYRVQFKDEVNAPDWTDLPGTTTAISSTGARLDASADAQSHRYYRVMLVP